MNKYFTVEQANKSLVLVEPITKDIIAKRKMMIVLKKLLKQVQDQEISNSLKGVSKEITHHLEELEMIGCYLKDFELGVIDFPSVMRGKVVFLCWMYGEDKVEAWHELTTGFESRKLISA